MTPALANSLYFMSFNIGSVFVCVTCLVYMVLRRRWDKPQSKIFLAIIIDLMVTAASDIAAEMIRALAVANTVSYVSINVAGFVYFVFHTALTPLFVLYVIAVCRSTVRQDTLKRLMIGLPFYISELLVLTNPITHWVFTYGSDLSFNRGWAVYFLSSIGALYFAMGMYQLIRNWRALTPAKRSAMVLFFILGVGGLGLQLAVPLIHIELFAESLAVLGILMFIENEDELIDSDAGVHNRRALEMDLNMYSNQGRPYYVVTVRVTNADAFARLGGSSLAAQFMTTELSDYFKTLVPWYRIYRTSPSRFVLVDSQMSREKASEIAHVIAERFKSSWHYHDVDISLKAVVVLACVPEDLPEPDDVFYLVDTPVPAVAGKDVLQGSDLNYLVRRAEVERAVRRGLEEGGYEVYYQPVFDVEGRPCAAEALMRLTDSVLGSISPFEFVEVAERMGLIEDIGDFALHEACKFMASGTPQRLGVDRISVNLSVIQCMQTGFTAHVDEVMAMYDVPPQSISFEITESIAAGNYELLGRVMGSLKESGHRFAMDDYGTGYSNMHSLVSLDFDVVKIDKSVLWDAEKSDMGMIILENGVHMLGGIGCEVLVEGVETASQVELLRRLGVDHLQGFYYAKPMPKAEFVEYLQQQRV